MNRKILITGGAGFIGTNAAVAFSGAGWDVHVFDNLERKGAHLNLRWLRERQVGRIIEGDVRDYEKVSAVCREHSFDAVLHLGGQVAVTTSVSDPRGDFETNARGTLNVLEAVRHYCPRAAFVYSSTNKVYGEMSDVPIVEVGGRYGYATMPNGVSETQPLDFHSPYGCSKGCGDQYVIDYARIYGLRTATFRQSCIYGPRQFGVEDQGWVAWLAIAAMTGRPITIYGDGKQIRDVLHVDDLIEAYKKAIAKPEGLNGAAFNIGGGSGNTLSLLELVVILEQTLGKQISVKFGEWRPGDQRVFVCDIRKAKIQLGWTPHVSVRDGIRKLTEWISQARHEIDQAFET